jgi:CspA family cold shock protein
VPTGTVKFFNANKGYGFIKPDDGGSDVFVHARDLQSAGVPQLVEGMRVGFDLETDPRRGKTKAGRLRLL